MTYASGVFQVRTIPDSAPFLAILRGLGRSKRGIKKADTLRFDKDFVLPLTPFLDGQLIRDTLQNYWLNLGATDRVLLNGISQVGWQSPSDLALRASLYLRGFESSLMVYKIANETPCPCFPSDKVTGEKGVPPPGPQQGL